MGTVNIGNLKPIEFVWRISSFMPYQMDLPEIKFIREELTSSALGDMKVYWGVAERLTDMRWVIDYRRLAKETLLQSEQSKEEMLMQYIELECYLHRIIATIGCWARTCVKAMNRIQKCDKERNIDIEHSSVIGADLKNQLMRIVNNIQTIVPKWRKPKEDSDGVSYL